MLLRITAHQPIRQNSILNYNQQNITTNFCRRNKQFVLELRHGKCFNERFYFISTLKPFDSSKNIGTEKRNLVISEQNVAINFSSNYI